MGKYFVKYIFAFSKEGIGAGGWGEPAPTLEDWQVCAPVSPRNPGSTYFSKNLLAL